LSWNKIWGDLDVNSKIILKDSHKIIFKKTF